MQNIPTKTYPLSILGDMDELLDEVLSPRPSPAYPNCKACRRRI